MFFAELDQKDGGIAFLAIQTLFQQMDKNGHQTFNLTKGNNKYYGRGTADMKGFIAVVLSLLKKLKIKEMKKPLFLIFSYDEEVGCLGIQKLVPF